MTQVRFLFSKKFGKPFKVFLAFSSTTRNRAILQSQEWPYLFSLAETHRSYGMSILFVKLLLLLLLHFILLQLFYSSHNASDQIV